MLRLGICWTADILKSLERKWKGLAGTVALCNKMAMKIFSSKLLFVIKDLQGYLNFTQMVFHLS